VQGCSPTDWLRERVAAASGEEIVGMNTRQLASADALGQDLISWTSAADLLIIMFQALAAPLLALSALYRESGVPIVGSMLFKLALWISLAGLES
jgi:hypothetical protein